MGTEIKAERITLGTTPKGSQWTKVPIPSCGGFAGGGFGCDAGCEAPQFESPIPGLWGNGPVNGCAGCDPACKHNQTCNLQTCGKVMDFQIVDKVKVPVLPLETIRYLSDGIVNRLPKFGVSVPTSKSHRLNWWFDQSCE